ncbi:MAG: D-glycerate dehydrogenase [Deltaproteobacteria bacterium]|nr:D-glycerate dehydrogenase [Deltaproteobacteria bacterium]
MSRVLVTQEIDPTALAMLGQAGLEVDERRGEAPIERSELLARVAGCEGLLPMLTDRIDAEVLDAAPLKVVSNHAVGVDNIDLPAAAERHIVVTHTPGVLTEATAELTLALLLATARRIVEADQFLRAGRYQGWRPTLLRGADLDGAVLGIVGLGRIGRAVAQRAEAFGMTVMHFSRNRGVALNELLDQADFLSLHCPLTEQTHHLIGEAQLRRMKPTAILINTARGPVVDEAALARALAERSIAAAGLDVFEQEPAVHPQLLELDNVVLLPHIASATTRCRRRMGVAAAANLVAVLAGKPPLNPVMV